MTTLVEIKFGSHLYGTSTPASDLDLKAVHLPTARELLLQQVKGVRNDGTKADNTRRNTADDVDRESYALQKYLGLAAEGQTVALDMLFAPGPIYLCDPSTQNGCADTIKGWGRGFGVGSDCLLRSRFWCGAPSRLRGPSS